MAEIKKEPGDKCLYCHETRECVKRQKLYCGLTDEYTGECIQEFPRHRFKPWTAKEIAEREEDLRRENEYWKRKAKETDIFS